MNKNKKNIIVIVALLVVTNLFTYYASTGKTSVLGDKTTVDVASVDDKTFTSNDIYTTWVEDNQSVSTLDALLTSVDEHILNDKYADDESVEEELELQTDQTRAYYESQGQDFDELLEQSGMDEDSWKELYRNQILSTKATQEYVESIITEEEVQAAYDLDVPKIKTSHILFKVEPSDDVAVEEVEQEALAKANEVYAELQLAIEESGDVEATFAEFATTYSEDETSKDHGGDIGYSNSEDALYQSAIEGLEIGEYTEVVQTSYGYSIILKTDVQEKASLDEESVYNTYKTQVAEEKIAENSTYTQKHLSNLEVLIT